MQDMAITAHSCSSLCSLFSRRACKTILSPGRPFESHRRHELQKAAHPTNCSRSWPCSLNPGSNTALCCSTASWQCCAHRSSCSYPSIFTVYTLTNRHREVGAEKSATSFSESNRATIPRAGVILRGIFVAGWRKASESHYLIPSQPGTDHAS
jgi:hypothetical protein